jgi:septation ring formation regulator EzrA
MKCARVAVGLSAIEDRHEAQEHLVEMSIAIAAKLVEYANRSQDREKSIQHLQRAARICQDPEYQRKLQDWSNALLAVNTQSQGCLVVAAGFLLTLVVCIFQYCL